MATILPADKQRFIDELIDLLKIPTISADSKYNDDIKKGASWVQNALSKAGCTETEIFPTKGHPIIYGERLIDPNLPTVLVYGHYDVQPPDPVELLSLIHI